MIKKVNILFCIFILMIYIVFLSPNVLAIEKTNKKSIFNKFIVFFKNLYKEGNGNLKSIDNKLNQSEKNYKGAPKRMETIKLQKLIGSSNCLRNLPRNYAIKINLNYDMNNMGEYFLSEHQIVDYSNQNFDLIIVLNYEEVLKIQNSTNIDLEIKKGVNSKDIVFESKNGFKVLKYVSVLKCFNQIETEEIIKVEINESLKLTNEQSLNITNETFQTDNKLVDVFYKQNLTLRKVKFLFKDIQNNLPYTVVGQNLSDYNILRAINILSNWNYNFDSKDYNYINWSEYISKESLILIGYTCNNSVTSLIINETECEDLIVNRKGVIKFYEYNSRNILVIVGSNGQDLVDSISILVNNDLFYFNDSSTILTNDSMYKLLNAPKNIRDIINELKSIYRKTEEYEDLISDRQLLYFVPYHPGKWFRDVHDGISANRYILSKEEKEILRGYNFVELAKKGDDIIEQRNLIKKEIEMLKSNINPVQYIKIDKNIINLETLEEYNKKLEKANKDIEKLDIEYNKLTDLVWKIKMPTIEIRRLTN